MQSSSFKFHKPLQTNIIAKYYKKVYNIRIMLPLIRNAWTAMLLNNAVWEIGLSVMKISGSVTVTFQNFVTKCFPFIICIFTLFCFVQFSGWYGDDACNTVEENSSVFSLIRMC